MQRKDISKKVIRFCRVAFIIAIICAVILAMAVMAYAQPYSVTDLGTLGEKLAMLTASTATAKRLEYP